MIVVDEALELPGCEDEAPEPAPLVAGVDVLVDGAELPHAASSAAPPARIGAAHHRLRMA